MSELENTIPGFVDGIVKDNVDPEGTARVRVLIPGLIEPISPFWCEPACFPGAGTPGRGSQYRPPDIDSPVYVMFCQGRYNDPETRAVYLTGYYGLNEEKVSAGPSAVRQAATFEKAARRTVIWEDDNFAFYFVDEEGPTDHRAVLETKRTVGGTVMSNSRIQVDAAAGESGKGECVTIESVTGISLFSKGQIDIKAGVVTIQGRRVIPGGGDL